MSQLVRQWSLRALSVAGLTLALILITVSCSTPPPSLRPPVGQKILEVKVDLWSSVTPSYEDETGRRFYALIGIGLNLDMRPIALNLVTWDEIFAYCMGFKRFHRVRPPDATPDPESQWSYVIPMPESFYAEGEVTFRVPLPDDLIGDPTHLRLLAFTRVVPDEPPSKVTESFTYHVVDVVGVNIEHPESVDFSQSAGYAFRDDEAGDQFLPFPELPESFYDGLDIRRVEVRVIAP